MLVDASVARSFAVIGWAHYLLQLGGGSILVADGVHGQHPGDPSELRSIRNALQRQADQADPGSGFASRALAAVHSLDQLLALAPNELTVVALSQDEFELAVRLQSRRPEDREWRRSLGARSRRLDAGESASIAIAARRSLAFASDDEDALTLWNALAGSGGHRTRDLLWQLVTNGAVKEADRPSGVPFASDRRPAQPRRPALAGNRAARLSRWGQLGNPRPAWPALDQPRASDRSRG